MCVIFDANVAGVLFIDSKKRSDAATNFLEYLDKREIKLVVGGKLLEELTTGSTKFKEWLNGAVQRESASIIPADKIEKEQKLLEGEKLKSDDPHVLALAIVSGASLLYTHDENLIADFKNRVLIPGRNRTVYKSDRNGKFTQAKRRQLKEAYCRV